MARLSEKQLLNTKCGFWFSLHHLSKTFLFPGRTECDILTNVQRSSCEVLGVICSQMYSGLYVKNWVWYAHKCTAVFMWRTECDMLTNVQRSSCEELNVICSQMYSGLHVKYPSLLSDLKETLIFSTDFRKIFQYQISRKYDQWVAAESFHADERTNTTNFIVAFLKFAEAPKNVTLWSAEKYIT
jgi:hypothetical protein